MERVFKYISDTNTDVPGYSDTPLTVTLWAGPKSFVNRVSGYSDTFDSEI